MGRYTGPKFRLDRREGVNMMLKGIRSRTAKHPLERQGHDTAPGVHGWRRSRGSEYGIRLREKQKVKRYYGVYDKQFMRYYRMAEQAKGNTGVAILVILERRLDNAVHKLGFAPSRSSARQMVAHGHLLVNGRKCDRPGYLVQVGDVLTIKDNPRSQQLVRRNLEELGAPVLQNWLSLDMTKLEGSVTAMPTRDDVQIPVEEHLIVEFCSQ
ncbi:MAG: 30S ribosomal protein S4 [Planctomycetes bacterium]|nr:30S ribosomal protein S4 [Planctomycetota bacterium]